MPAIPNLIEMSNAVTKGRINRDLLAPAFVKSTTMLNLMKGVDVSSTGDQPFYKEGFVVAALAAESNPVPINANGELTRTKVDSSVSKAVVSSGITVEAERFTDLDLPTVARAQGSAIGRHVDNDALSQFGALSQVVTALGALTIDDIMLCQLAIDQAEVPNKEVPVVAVLAPKGFYDIKKEIIQSGASVWANPNTLTILNGTPQPNNYRGSLPGVDIYVTTGHAQAGGDNQQAVFHPLWTFAGQFDTAPTLRSSFKASEGLYTEAVTYYFYDVVEWCDPAGVLLNSDA